MTTDAEDEYERAVRAVVAAAVRCRSDDRPPHPLGEAGEAISDAITILRGIIRVSFPERQDIDELAELTSLTIVIDALGRDGAKAVAGFNAAAETCGLAWRLTPR
jgi:hypothetical protein